MKRKSIFFTLFVLIFGFCGTLSYFNNPINITNAVSQDASVWDGEFVENESELTESDWYNENVNNYYIRSAAGLSYFVHSVNDGTVYKNKNIYLDTDIDLANYNWTPIGNAVNIFQGSFYGQGHTIYNLEINDATSSYVGFFGTLTDYSKVDNLHLRNVNIDLTISNSDDYYVGTMVGYFNNTGNVDRSYSNSYITNCSVEGEINISSSGSTQNFMVGGLAGSINNASVRTSKTEVKINIDSVNAQNLRVGGLTGSSDYLVLSDCYYDGDIEVSSTATSGYMGGLVGYLSGISANYSSTIENTYSKGKIVLSNNGKSFYIGGIVGRVNNEYFVMNNSYHVGDIKTGDNNIYGTNYMSGLIGQLQASSFANTKMLNCFYIGSLSGNNYNQNYLYPVDKNLGESQKPEVGGLYFDVDMKSTAKGDLANQIINLDSLAKTKDFYLNERYWDSEKSWNFSDSFSNWDISSGINDGYPYLKQLNNIGNANNDSDYSAGSKLEGEGTAESPYLIKTAGDLGYMSFNFQSKKYYSLQNNIDLSGRTWQPIGTLSNPFNGVFDGNGYTIYGLTCSLQEKFGSHGLFGVTSNAVIKNLKIKNVKYINEGTNSGYIGTFIGYVKGDTYLINCADNEYSQAGTKLSDGSNVYSVGRVDSDANIFVFYGTNSTNSSGNLIENNIDTSNNGDFYGNINLSGTKTSTGTLADVYYGYDLTINGNGGNFYNSNKVSYKGKYHLLVMPTGENAKIKNIALTSTGNVASEVVNVSSMDSTFGVGLPQLSHLFGTTDTIIKKGFKAVSFNYTLSGATDSVLYSLSDSQKTEVLNFDINYSKAPLHGVNVNWQVYGYNPNDPNEADKDNAYQIKVIYNTYEKEEFGATSYDYDASSEVQVDEDGNVYKIFYLEYDAFLSDYPEIFEVPSYKDKNGVQKLLRNGDFAIEGVYQEGYPFAKEILTTEPVDGENSADVYYASNTLANSILSDASIVGEVYLANLYVNWEGIEKLEDGHEFDLTISLNPLEGTDEQSSFAGNFDIKDAITSIEVYQVPDASNPNLEKVYREFSGDSLIVNDNKVKVNVTITTTKLSDTTDNYWYVVVTLKNGFIYSGDGTKDKNYNGTIDTNFGVDSSSGVKGEWRFYNLVSDYNLTLVVSRDMKENELSIGTGVYMGLTPFVTGWNKVSVIGPNGEKADISSLTNNESLKTVYQNGENFVGFDFMKNKILSSSASYDAIDLTSNYILTEGNKKSVLFEYEFAGESKYYLYEFVENDQSYSYPQTIYLYTSDANRQKTDMVVQLDSSTELTYRLSYYAYTNFGIIYSTETDATIFSVVSQFNSSSIDKVKDGEQREVDVIIPNGANPSKIYMVFESIIKINNGESIEATTRYSQAIFNFNTKYLAQDQDLLDENGDVNYVDIEKNSPTIYSVVKDALGQWNLTGELKSKIYSVDVNSGEIAFAVQSTDFYKFFVKRGGTDNITLFNNTGSTANLNLESCNIKIAVSDENDQVISDYEERFNLNNQEYITISASSTYVKSKWIQSENGGFEYQNEFFVIILNYSAGNGGLQAGNYTLDVVCTDVFYNMNYATKFVNADVDVSQLKDVKLLENEESSDIETVVTANGEKYEQNNSSIKFDNEITVSTYMQTNNAYEFWGWYIKGSNYSRFVAKGNSLPSSPSASTPSTLSFEYGDMYFSTSGTNLNELGFLDENNAYNITIYAVFQRKQTTIDLSQRVIIENRNGEQTEYTSYAINLNLSFALRLNDGSSAQSIVYNYTSNTNSEEQFLSNFNFVMTGTDSTGYYISGYRLFDVYGDVVEVNLNGQSEKIEYIGNKYDNNVSMNFDIYKQVKTLMEQGETSKYQEYTITPIIRQKSANITFHSGTGSSGYGDTKNGHVFDVSGENETTDTYFTTTEIYFDTTIYLNSPLDGNINSNDTTESVIVENLFSSRTGYVKKSNNYWVSTIGEQLNGMTLQLSTSYFKDSQTLKELHFYVVWEARNYNIRFMPNGGIFDGIDSISITATYDSNEVVYNNIKYYSTSLDNITAIKDKLQYIGYENSGWSLDADNNILGRLVFDANLGLISGQEYSLFDEKGNYICPSDSIVYAVWVECPYTIKIMLNGANSYDIHGQKTSIPNDEQKEFGLEIDIRYDSTFAEMFFENDEENKIKISEIVLEREGYKFNGFYAISGNLRQNIDDYTVFTTNIISCSQTMTEDIVLTLYANWTFDISYLSLSLTQSNLPSLVYNAGQQTIYLADYFKLGYQANGYVVSLDENGQDMSITLSPNMNSSILLSLSSEKATIDNYSDLSFKVRNVGNYSVSLSITITDDASYLNLGNVYNENCMFYIEVTKAGLDSSVSDEMYVENVKRIMEPFMNVEFNAKLQSCSTLDGVTNLMKSEDSTITGTAGEELNNSVYEYIMFKYYMLLNSNVGETYKTYKEWTYADYLNYISDENNATSVSNIVSSLSHFDFYDYTISDSSMNIDGYDNLEIVSDAVQNVGLELAIDKIVISSNTVSNLSPNNSYEMRVYLKNVVSSVDSLANYNVQYDANGDAFITAGTAFLLPQTILVQNLESTKSAYFEANVENKEVAWAGNRESLEYGSNTYYLIENNLYLSAELYTSSSGDLLTDTIYSFTNKENYLFFDNVSIILKTENSGEVSYTNISSYFKPIMAEDDVFTIMNTNGVANLTVTANYLTNKDGMIYFEKVEDIMASELLRITRVYYNIDGTEKDVYDADGLEETSFSDNGVLVYEITENNSNSVSIFVSPTVTKVVFSATSSSISDYIGLYKWVDSPIYSVDGTMDTKGSLTVDMSLIEKSDEGMTNINYYAVYTDLVLVKYNLNFPSSYNLSSSQTATMKLGETTANDLAIPSESGFVLASLKAKTPTGETLDYTEIFTGEDSGNGRVYVGITPETKFAIVTLEAKWNVEDIAYNQILTSYRAAVESFTSLTVDDIVAISNKNTTLYEYTYAWYFNDQKISEGQIMKLENNGSYDESGNYKLVVNATLNSEFVISLEDASKTSTSVEINFTLEFMRNIIDKITLPEPESVVVTYDGREHISDWSVNVDIYIYNPSKDAYEETVTTQQLHYVTTGSIYFKVYFNGGEVNSMKNAGEYRINICIDEGSYDISGVDSSNLEFVYTINALSVDLSEYDFNMSKQFNSVEPSLTKEIYLTNENVPLQLERDAGEDVGYYNIYLKDNLQEYKMNYTFTYGDVVLFENGALTAEAKTTAIGTFAITKGGTLRLSYEVTALNPMAVEANYSNLGYSLKLTEDFRLQIYNGDVVYKEFYLNLFDLATSENISSDVILNILRTKISDIQPTFFNTESYQTAYNSMTYTYSFALGDEISKYYTNIEFEAGYTFTIKTITVDVSGFKLQKTYDGTTNIYLDLTGKTIDLDSYSGVYIAGTFLTAHAGTNVRVDLSLQRKDSTENLSNYELTASYVVGAINKLDGTMSFTMSKTEFAYGEISLNNFSSFIGNYIVMNSDNQLVTNLLVDGYYTISYTLKNPSTNEKGFLYKGNYTIGVNAEFQDFNMTINEPSFEVLALQYEVQIPENYIQISVLDKVQEYYENAISIQSTGDTINLRLAPEGLTAGQNANTGIYNLLLVEDTFLNGSVVVSINENNKGLQVLFATETVYVRIDDTSILTNSYSGQNYNVSSDVSKILTVSNGTTNLTSALTFFLKVDEGGEVVEKTLGDGEISFATLSIGFEDSITEVSKAGQYKLSILAQCNEYVNVVFVEDYYLNIEKLTIDIAQFTFEKTYDGIGSYIISDFNEKIDGDDVSILVQFDSAISGEGKNVNLYLGGTDMNNYELSSATSTGSINKAEAIVELVKTDLVYGEVSLTQPLSYIVKAGTTNLLPSQYSLTLEIENANYSASGYLTVGTYTVALSAQSSTNYDLILNTTQIQVSAYDLTLQFNTDGEIYYEFNSPEANSDQFTYIYITPLYESIEILMTRESGKDIGYYKILSGTSNDTNYYVLKVDDKSELGAFRISQAKERLYLLLSDEEIVTASSIADTATIKYDGILYDTVSVEETEEDSGLYRLVITSSTTPTAEQQFDLNFYTYDSTSQSYTKTDVTVYDLKTTIKFLNPTIVKNVGTYEIYASGTSSSNYEVKMGKNGVIYSFYLKIEKKELYFLQSEQSKVFDNKDAVFEYSDANDMLTGIVAGEKISLSMRFTQNGEVVKYVGVNYDVEAEIFGDTISNYNLNLTDEEGTDLNATIYRAEIVFVVNSQNYTYGEDYELQFKYQTDVDLTGYDMSRISMQLTVPDKELYLSTSGALKVGEYNMIMLFSANDFSIGGYIINNQEQDDLLAKLTISPRQLQLVEKDISLQEVFTKTYDGNNNVKIADDDGTILFGLSGIHQSTEGVADSVQVLSAHYASENVGQAIQVSFELSGEDSANYTISPWMYGIIKAIIVGLEFDYRAEGSNVTSNVDDNHLLTLSQLSFPFMSTSYLTSNSASSSTNSIKNFPTSLTGRTGYAFLNWTMDFENIENASAELSYLEDVVTKLGLEHSYANSTYSIVVDNGEKTVRFLNELLLDENNVLGYYYKTATDLKFKFNANWDTNKYRITIMLADENGKSASYGSVEIDDGNPDTENTTVTTNYLGEFDYDSSITLRPTANAHCYYVGYYSSDGKKYIGTEPFISITREGDMEVFTITNIRQTYNLVVRFAAQKVNVVFDLSEYSDATVNSKDFVDIGNSMYQWTTDYLTLESLYISDLPEVTRLGYNVVSLSTSTTTISKDNFENTKIISLIPDSNENAVTLTLTPNFEAVGVVVTLDYGYDSIRQDIVVPYGQAYQTSNDWVETPLREGYTFDGWYNSLGTRVYGGDILSTTETHTLTAHWTINKYSLELIAEHATISDANVVFAFSGNSYTASEIEYGYRVTFKVVADNGYEISSAWSAGFDVVINEDKTADITFTMPADNVTYQLPIIAITNTVTIQGEHLGEIRAYDVTEEETEIAVANNQFEIATGRVFKIVVSAEIGYVVADRIDGGDGLTIDKAVENGVLIATIEGVDSDTTLNLFTEESRNKISILFDDEDVVETIEIDGKTYNSVSELPEIEVNTNAILSFYVKFKHGYGLGSYVCEEFTVSYEFIEDGAYIDNYLFEVSDISTDGTILINSALAKYTLNLEVISYNENKEQVDIAGNIALANGLTSIEAEYNSTVLITYQVAELYSFAGWSKDGINIFSTEARLNYTITQDETIYAIFSTLRFNIDFGTYNYYTIYDEYNDPEMTETIYTEISGARYFDADSGKEISGIELYYGANKNIKYQVPNGYMYYGYGYRDGQDFVYLKIEESVDREVAINISSLLLNQDNLNVKIYIVVKAYSLTVEFETKIDIDGTREEDVDVGYIALQDSSGNDVNQYGYVDGTRVHYSPDDFENGQVLSNKNFEVVAYTNDVIYLKVKILKQGYKFSSIGANLQDIYISKVTENNEYLLFEISNLVGGTDSIYIEVLFKPIINVINLSFVNNDLTVDGGAFNFNISEDNKNKVWTSGREYSSVVVSAYTDSYFEVVALIRAGYHVNGFDLQISDSAGIIVPESVTYEALKVADSGYTGKITFMVANYLGVSSITIGVTPMTYTVQLMEDTNVLAIIDNVNFNSALNLTEYNAANITIVDERVYFQSGRLKVDLQKAQHNFEGYFTYQNGAGVQYINSQGNPVNTWQESGYVLNTLTSKYELSENAVLDPDTGKITIKLYLYWSYLKTRINFEFVPDIRTNYTAQDMVSGVDFSNSWFYETAPMYIEVSFNTDIRIVAPTIDGYQFYKFVISQKNSEGTWLTDVVSFSNDIPWSTNEYDRIVECRIQVVYFAKVEVTLFGGEGTFNIYQESSDTQAKLLLQDGYVDTTKEFTIEAVPNDGYAFLRWVNSTTGQSTFNKTMSLTISRKTNLVMNLQGETVTLNFEDYDTTYGQITNLNVLSLDNSYNSYRLGGYSGDDFLKILTEVDVKVGDELTFIVSVDFGFGVVWNRKDITFKEYTGNMYYFTMNVPTEIAGQTIDIIPTFEDEILAVYISRSFAEDEIDENVIDYNNVNMAGYVTYNGQTINHISFEEGKEVRIVTVTNPRYEIDNITIQNYDNVFDNMSDFFTEEGVIVLTPEFIEFNNIVGTIEISIEYKRVLWEDEIVVSEFEGSGTSRDPYQIKTVEDLILMMNYVNNGTYNPNGIKYKDSFFILMNDLELNEKFWTPIGTDSNAFNGYFNFNKHNISGVYTAYFYNPVSYNGLFGVLGTNAKIVQNEESLWYVYLIIGLVVLIVLLLIILILTNKKRKKRRKELSTK